MENELPVPSEVARGEEADEVLRVWIVDGELHVVLAAGAFPDGAEWGRLLFDLSQEIAEGAADALEGDPAEVFDELLSGFLEEMDAPDEDDGDGDGEEDGEEEEEEDGGDWGGT